jgi:hypothetical protein
MSHFCDKCGEYVFRDECRCQPYLVYLPDYYGEEKKEIFGHSFEGIAEKVAEEVNQDDCRLNQEIFDPPIEIINVEGEVKRFNVYAEPDINYHVNEAKE